MLIHERAGRRIDTFPALASADFGVEPDFVTTDECDLARIVGTAQFSSGELLPGDQLVFATDALAHWSIASDEQRRSPWSVLTEVGPSGSRI